MTASHGASVLVDRVLAGGFLDLSVLDVSMRALREDYTAVWNPASPRCVAAWTPRKARYGLCTIAPSSTS